ncbi:MAG: alpha/beta hydrolase [Anaerolineales bacterium]|nr:alpha/beta hydrolase [Anaerolineales bacterium]
MSAIILDGSMVHYEALGRGRPTVFLHGWVGSWRYWINAMQVASTAYRAYAVDLFGFGDSAKDPLRYPLEKQADLINRFLEEMGIGKVALVGHGLGALVAMSFIKQWPKSVDRMMAISSPMDYDAINARLRTASPTELVDWLSARTPESTSALADASKADPTAVSASIASFQANNLFPEIRNLGVPCLFVYGPNDPGIAAPSQEKADSLPLHMHLIQLENAGHFPMVDNPSQFNRLLTDFLALDSGVTPKDLQLKEEWKRRVR